MSSRHKIFFHWRFTERNFCFCRNLFFNLPQLFDIRTNLTQIKACICLYNIDLCTKNIGTNQFSQKVTDSISSWKIRKLEGCLTEKLARIERKLKMKFLWKFWNFQNNEEIFHGYRYSQWKPWIFCNNWYILQAEIFWKTFHAIILVPKFAKQCSQIVE